MSVGKRNLSVRAMTVKNAAEKTVEEHPGREKGRSREEAIAETIAAMVGGVLMFVTNRDGWRDKIRAMKTREIEKAIKELVRAEYAPAIIALNSMGNFFPKG